MDQTEPEQNKRLIPAPKVAIAFGITRRSLARWIANPALGFPRPIEINGRLYVREAELEAWKINRCRQSRG